MLRAQPTVSTAPSAETLVYTSDDQPGWRRVVRGRGFAYLGVDGQALRNPAALKRIRQLAIPPAYQAVWICPVPHGHLQATGRDARGRKQYLYHPAWRQAQEATKFERLAAFGLALPRIRRRVRRDLQRPSRGPGLTRERVLATIVRLLDTTFARVGNDAYARDNGSFGLTTLRNRHARVRAGVLDLSFRGKSGIDHRLSVDDAQVVAVVRRCQQLPGQLLFQYLDDDGMAHRISSADVNDYLAEAAGERFTAKDFRTWHGSVQALALACAFVCPAAGAAPLSQAAARRQVTQWIAQVARQLGNTVAVCRKSYIHPAILDHALARACAKTAALPAHGGGAQRGLQGLRADERRLLQFLAAVPTPQEQRLPRERSLLQEKRPP